MFVSRQRRGPDRFARIKLACLVLGGGLGLVGMRLGSAVLVDVAIVIVLAGFGLRVVSRESDAAAEARTPEGTGPGTTCCTDARNQ